MDRLVYVAMTGAKQAAQALSTVSHNLANVATTGFRADLQAFSSRPIEGAGFQTRVNAVAESQGWDARPGTLVATGRDLDVAIRGEGWLTVQLPEGGEAYTRAGDLRVTSSGALETRSGHILVGDNGPVTLPEYQTVFIGGDGSITIVPDGQKADVTSLVNRLKLVNPPPDQLTKGADGLMRMIDGGTAQSDAAVGLASGHLESSNVNPAEALVEMIQLSRQFELQVKAIGDAEKNEQASTALLRMS